MNIQRENDTPTQVTPKGGLSTHLLPFHWFIYFIQLSLWSNHKSCFSLRLHVRTTWTRYFFFLTSRLYSVSSFKTRSLNFQIPLPSIARQQSEADSSATFIETIGTHVISITQACSYYHTCWPTIPQYLHSLSHLVILRTQFYTPSFFGNAHNKHKT